MDLQDLFHVRKGELVGLFGKLIEQFIGELDVLVGRQLVLPVYRVLPSFALAGIRE